MENIRENLATPVAQAVIWVSVAVALSVAAYYLLSKLRDRDDDEDTTARHLENFRDLKQRGVLHDAEFRTIKSSLSDKLMDEVRDADE